MWNENVGKTDNEMLKQKWLSKKVFDYYCELIMKMLKKFNDVNGKVKKVEWREWKYEIKIQKYSWKDEIDCLKKFEWWNSKDESVWFIKSNNEVEKM